MLGSVAATRIWEFHPKDKTWDTIIRRIREGIRCGCVGYCGYFKLLIFLVRLVVVVN